MPHYFQRYASKENWVTNATLLLLSRLYHFDRYKFENAINAVLGQSAGIKTSVEFDQQKKSKGGGNVIDGLISQPSFAIAIETKLYDNQYKSQLIRHLNSLKGNAETKVLLALSVNETPEALLESVRKEIKQGFHDDNIKVISTTYELIIEAINQELDERRDVEMLEVVADYQALCEEHDLLNIGDRTMIALPVKQSFEMNLKHSIYYCPSNRNHNRPFSLLGFYLSGRIEAIGKVEVIVTADLVDGKLVFQEPPPSGLTDGHKKRIVDTITETSYYELEKGMRFYLLDNLVKDLGIPVSKPIMRSKYFVFDRAPAELSNEIAFLRSEVERVYSL